MLNLTLNQKIAETAPVKKVASFTGQKLAEIEYFGKKNRLLRLIKFNQKSIFFYLAKKELDKFHKAGGVKKLKDVTKEDIKEAKGIVKESLTYDLPQLFKKMLRDFDPRRKH